MADADVGNKSSFAERLEREEERNSAEVVGEGEGEGDVVGARTVERDRPRRRAAGPAQAKAAWARLVEQESDMLCSCVCRSNCFWPT